MPPLITHSLPCQQIQKMIVENVPSDFLFLELPISVFSDDSRFIYMLMRWQDPLSISVYDVIYNKFITLLPDKSVEDLPHINEFKEGTVRPSILFIDNHTLLILFNDHLSDIFDGTGAVLLLVIHLNFCDNSFSILDSKIIEDCNSEARLVKNQNKFLVVHNFAVDKEEFDNNNQFLAYYTFELHDNHKIDIQKSRIVFNFDYRNSGYMITWHVCNNKLWCIRNVGRTSDKELLNFDLNEVNPSENSIEIFEERGEIQAMFQWGDNILIKYYPNTGEFTYLDLSTIIWSKIFQRRGLQSTENIVTDAKRFFSFDTSGTCVTFERHFDDALSAIIFDKFKKQLFKIPFRTPPKLIDFAWITVLNNNNLFIELNKRKIEIYSPLF